MAPRQTHLALDDAEFELAQRWANYRVLRQSHIGATTLAAFAQCRTKPFLRRILDAAGLSVTTWAMRQGIRAHEEVQGALDATAEPSDLTLFDALQQGRFLFANEYHLHDPHRNLRGIADIVYVADGTAHVVELKNMRPPAEPDPVWNAPVWFDHGLQVQVYGLLLQTELKARPLLHVVYLMDGAKGRFLETLAGGTHPERALAEITAGHAPLSSTLETDRYLGDLVREMRRAERQPLLPMPGHENPQTCASCPVKVWCPRRLDRPGEFAQVPVSALRLEA